LPSLLVEAFQYAALVFLGCLQLVEKGTPGRGLLVVGLFAAVAAYVVGRIVLSKRGKREPQEKTSS
jgi:hypothetical protein